MCGKSERGLGGNVWCTEIGITYKVPSNHLRQSNIQGVTINPGGLNSLQLQRYKYRSSSAGCRTAFDVAPSLPQLAEPGLV
ncbi:unnamed protein product [Arctia plantaginis]|uniref:Uncharacterized protein n=1 Tax=Arctia plantaginis TaxID=874455 RepID=A0A8S0ZTH2_ARCPL|nr:unnamed protein product [Arctia plantaginis]